MKNSYCLRTHTISTNQTSVHIHLAWIQQDVIGSFMKNFGWRKSRFVSDDLEAASIVVPGCSHTTEHSPELWSEDKGVAPCWRVEKCEHTFKQLCNAIPIAFKVAWRHGYWEPIKQLLSDPRFLGWHVHFQRNRTVVLFGDVKLWTQVWVCPWQKSKGSSQKETHYSFFFYR